MFDGLPERIQDKINLTDSCWVWTASRDQCGYGRVGVKGKNRHAHRVIYELLVGPIPDGLELDHLCRNRACVNPNHLEPVTHKQNMRRGKAGEYNKVKTHCKRGHEFTEENTYHHSRNDVEMRVCKTCERERLRSPKNKELARIRGERWRAKQKHKDIGLLF